MVVRMQSSGLSLLSPMVTVFNAAGTTLLGQQSSVAYGDTVGVTLTGVTPGRTYLIRARGATSGNSGYGAYALQVNFGSSPLGAVAVPGTVVAQTTDLGGGPLAGTTRGEDIGVGGLTGRGDVLMVDGHARPDHAHTTSRRSASVGMGTDCPTKTGADSIPPDSLGARPSSPPGRAARFVPGATQARRPFARLGHPPFGGRH